MKDRKREGYAKLLDAWVAPENAGEPVGCLATSFTFDPAFFEEECLARFLDIQADPDEDGPIYLVEREEKLAGATCAALVDARHCRGARSLRWDLLSARVPRGAMHAKVSLLCWQHRVRLIVASANLTQDGYRRNQEVFGVLDFHEGSPTSSESLEEVLDFLGSVADSAGTGDGSDHAQERWASVLGRAREIGAGAGSARSGSVRVRTVLTGPDRPSAFDQLQGVWPRRTPPMSAHVVSPFFDPGPRNGPAEGLWRVLRRRGSAQVMYHVTAEEVPSEEGLIVHAPESLPRATPAQRDGVECHVARIREYRVLEDDPIDFRPLHAKTLTLYDSECVCALIGSSNFTSSGLGLSSSPNVEANLVYILSRERDPKAASALEAAQLRGDPLDPESISYWRGREDETEEAAADWPSLPSAFQSATLSAADERAHRLTLSLDGKPPSGWAVFLEDHFEPLYTETEWQAEGRPAEVVLTLAAGVPPTGLEVGWDATDLRAWWPVNVVDATALPPPAELRNLSLDALIHILTSARPLKDAMRAWMRRNQAAQQLGEQDPDEIDPHKRVDTSRFLLQRTRRVSWALAGLRERLERPVPTVHALRWRLHGPVGVQRIAEALRAEKRSEEEYAFLLAELALEISRVRPASALGCLPPEQVREELGPIVEGLVSDLDEALSGAPPATRSYIDGVATHLRREFATA